MINIVSRLFFIAAVLGFVLGSADRADATLFARVADRDLAAQADVIAEAVVLEVDAAVVTSPPSTTVQLGH